MIDLQESPEIARLGIPAFYWGTNAIHGVQWGNATSFPQAANHNYKPKNGAKIWIRDAVCSRHLRCWGYQPKNVSCHSNPAWKQKTKTI